MQEKRALTIGYSFEDEKVQIGYYSTDMEEPQLLGQTGDTGRLHIPVCICKLNHSNQWLFGEEAQSAAKEGHGTLVENLTALCESKEPVVVDDVPYMPGELLGIFIKKSMSLLHRICNLEQIYAMTFVFPLLSMKLLQVMRTITAQLPVAQNRCYLLEEKESFYHFVMHQKRELWNNDVMLLDARGGGLKIWTLGRRKAAQMTPFVVAEQTLSRFSFGEKDARTDAQFAKLLEQVIQKRLVSCIFLTGREFEGGWMQEAKRVLCRGRKVFAVDHIGVRGACFRGLMQPESGGRQRRFYMGVHQLKHHLGLYVWNGREQQYCRLIWAGTNWYEAVVSHTFLVDNCDSVSLQMDAAVTDDAPPDARSIRKMISLDWLPKRPHLATKIRIDIAYENAEQCRITITDIGLGELFPASEKSVTERMGG